MEEEEEEEQQQQQQAVLFMQHHLHFSVLYFMFIIFFSSSSSSPFKLPGAQLTMAVARETVEEDGGGGEGEAKRREGRGRGRTNGQKIQKKGVRPVVLGAGLSCKNHTGLDVAVPPKRPLDFSFSAAHA